MYSADVGHPMVTSRKEMTDTLLYAHRVCSCIPNLLKRRTCEVIELVDDRKTAYTPPLPQSSTACIFGGALVAFCGRALNFNFIPVLNVDWWRFRDPALPRC